MPVEPVLTFVAIARIPQEGVGFFQIYEDRVLPILAEYGGQLERRMRNEDGTVEMHIISFPNQASFDGYSQDFRRSSQVAMLEKSGAQIEVLLLNDVATD